MEKVIGIDSGRQTYCTIATKEGKILSHFIDKSCNWELVGEEHAFANLKELLQKCTTVGSKGKVAALCIGSSSIELEKDKKKLYDFVSRLNVAEKVIIEDDLKITLVGATLKNYGVVISASLSSVAFGINRNGQEATCGGFRHVLGDEGSTYIISKQAVIKAIHAFDGRGKKTTLLTKIPHYFNLPSIPAVTVWLYSHEFNKYKFANLFHVVVKEALNGDRVAQEVLNQATSDLVSLCKGCIKKLNMQKEEFDLAIIGEVFTHSYNLILPKFEEQLKKFSPNVNIIRPYFPPSTGAIILALQACDIKINNKIINNLTKTLK